MRAKASWNKDTKIWIGGEGIARGTVHRFVESTPCLNTPDVDLGRNATETVDLGQDQDKLSPASCDRANSSPKLSHQISYKHSTGKIFSIILYSRILERELFYRKKTTVPLPIPLSAISSRLKKENKWKFSFFFLRINNTSSCSDPWF